MTSTGVFVWELDCFRNRTVGQAAAIRYKYARGKTVIILCESDCARNKCSQHVLVEERIMSDPTIRKLATVPSRLLDDDLFY